MEKTMNPLAEKESQLMRIVIGGSLILIQAERTADGKWNYHEGKKEILKSKYNPFEMKVFLEREYRNQGRSAKIKLY